jgi:hypothetical protein
MRSKKEIVVALQDFQDIPMEKFLKKYGLETLRECEGFVKALKWVLEKEAR